MAEMGEVCRQKLVAAVKSAADRSQNYSPGKRALILSGGVDTCAVAMAAAEAKVPIDLAITVVISEVASDGEDISSGTDEPYATLIAKQHGYPHHIVRMTAAELVAAMLPFCVRVLECFDGMQLRNSMVVAAALHEAKELGCTQVLTGDAADELLGGYSFTWGSEEPVWSEKRADLVSAWYFSGPIMGQALGVGSDSPYMEEAFVQWALSTRKEDCIGGAEIHAKPRDKPEQHTAGKLPLRRAYPDAISAWRRKDPIEKGSGSVRLSDPAFWANSVEILQGTSKELPAVEARDSVAGGGGGGLAGVLESVGKEGGVVLRDYEHLVYYREFQRQFPTAQLPSRQRHGQDPCKECGWQLKHAKELFCHTCGAYPAQHLPSS